MRYQLNFHRASYHSTVAIISAHKMFASCALYDFCNRMFYSNNSFLLNIVWLKYAFVLNLLKSNLCNIMYISSEIYDFLHVPTCDFFFAALKFIPGVSQKNVTLF